MTPEFKDIIKGCIKGKLSAQEKLYKNFSRKMFGICMIYTKDPNMAEDILQEGFIKIFEKIGQFRFEGSFEGWMRRIIVNTAIEKFRKQNYLYPVEEVETYSDDYVDNDALQQISSDDMLQLINELSPQYQMVFNLYAIEGYSHQEISKKLGISEGTSKSNLSRARKILQEKLVELYGKEIIPRKIKMV